MTKQVKSKQRVADHGEVFTAEREVKAMCDLVKTETERIDSRFLEPACGDGNFLAEILSRKLAVVKKKYKKFPMDYEKNSVLAVSSLYGVDILQDNCEACRERLYRMWDKEYKAVCKKEVSEDCRRSVRFILSRNIVCGNALSLMCVDENQQDTGDPIVFSEWAFVTGYQLQRSDYTFARLMQGDDEARDLFGKKKRKKREEQMTLFDADEPTEKPSDEGEFLKKYVTHYRRVERSRIDVSYMSDEEYEHCLDRLFDSLLYQYMNPKLFTGEKFMGKHLNIGDQVAQTAGISYRIRIDNYVKIVRGVKFYAGYMDDSYAIHESKEFLQELLEDIVEIANELGITVNTRKTRICKLSEHWRFLQVQYSLTDTGRVIQKINPKRLTAMRRKMKKLAPKLTEKEFTDFYKSWFKNHYKIMSKKQRSNMDTLFNQLKEVTKCTLSPLPMAKS